MQKRTSLQAYLLANDATVYKSWVFGTWAWNKLGSNPPGSGPFPPERIDDIFITRISPKGMFHPGTGIATADHSSGFHSHGAPNNQVYALFVNKDGALSCTPCFGGPFKNQK
jgi:hypothetical protein